MQSPPAEWLLMGAHITALNLLRNAGEPDLDTISEQTRSLVERHPLGRQALAVGLTVGGFWFYHHIVDPLKES